MPSKVYIMDTQETNNRYDGNITTYLQSSMAAFFCRLRRGGKQSEQSKAMNDSCFLCVRSPSYIYASYFPLTTDDLYSKVLC